MSEHLSALIVAPKRLQQVLLEHSVKEVLSCLRGHFVAVGLIVRFTGVALRCDIVENAETPRS